MTQHIQCVGSGVGMDLVCLLQVEDDEIFTAVVSLGEVVSWVQREGRDGRRAADMIDRASIIVPMDLSLAVSAGLIHAEKRRQNRTFPSGDAAVLATAKRLKAKVLTDDPHFAGIEGVEFLRS